ncbi:MAG: glycerophosphodiester phosphodiesterase [Bacteroidales bacterium]|nr:glycerophosphodiester phosphodiesterase [Bacteroidales bacterium]
MKRILAIAVVALMGVTALSAQTRMLAHRGGKAEQDENTLAAFKATYAAGCHGFETDIHITADGKYVIMHDGLLDRTTTGSGRVEQLSSAYIRTITTKGGEPVPFLEDLLDFFKDCEGLYVEFEMKTNQEFYPEELLHKYCEDVYSMVTAAKPKDALFVFTSFDPRPLLYLRAHHPDAEVMYITGKPCSHETVDLCKALGINRLAATVNASSRESVKYAHQNGLLVSLWPGEKCADSHMAFLMGSDYLCSDIPLELMQYIKDNNLPILY